MTYQHLPLPAAREHIRSAGEDRASISYGLGKVSLALLNDLSGM